MIHVLDAGPMMAFLKGEAGDQVVLKILMDNPNQCFAHIFNLTEVFYLFYRAGGTSAAETAIKTLMTAGVTVREDADTAFWQAAATLKGKHALALPDAFCLALAMRLSGAAVTTDHAEFDPLVPLAYCPIIFIR